MTSLPTDFTPHFASAPARGSVRAPHRAAAPTDPLRWLRLAIFAYFLLWLFEGALRKWVLPGLSTPLLIVRDPVLLFIYFEALRQKVWKLDGFTIFLLILGTLATVVSLGLFKPPPLKVIAFGIHSNFLHLPLIFLLPQIISYTEVRKMGRIVLWLAPPMAMLVALQFLSPSGATVNVGAGGEGKMLETALNRIRPSGLFSFTNGLASYTVMLCAFLFHHLLEKKIFPKVAFILAAPSLLILVVMSGSRTVFALVALEMLTVLVIWIVKPRFMKSSIKLVAIGAAVVLLVGSFGALRLGMDVIIARFTNSGGMQRGVFERVFGEFKKPFDSAARAEPAGVGIGMGTNAASSMMYKMLRFNLGESESDRIVMEMGPYLGLPYLLWRFAVLLYIARLALRALQTQNNTLPLLLTTACANDLVMGQFGQSTVLGYAVMISGLALASRQRRPEEGLTSYEGFDPVALPTARSLRIARLNNPSLFHGEIAPIESAPTAENEHRPTYAERLRLELQGTEIKLPVGARKKGTSKPTATIILPAKSATKPPIPKKIVRKKRPTRGPSEAT